MENIFDEKNVPKSNWFKFINVGDRVSGEVLEVFIKKSTNETFGDQRVFVLKQDNGEVINVGIKTSSDYLMSRTNGVEAGDKVGFLFKAEIPAKTKGYHPAKSLDIFVIKRDKKIVADEVAF